MKTAKCMQFLNFPSLLQEDPWSKIVRLRAYPHLPNIRQGYCLPFVICHNMIFFCLLVLYLPLFFVQKGFCSIGNNGTGLSFLLSETRILCPPLCAGIVLRVHVDGCEHVVMSANLSPCQNLRSQSQSGGWGLGTRTRAGEGQFGLF